jgi:uncharacterized protein
VTIWVLADDRAGNRAQCLGGADKLGLPYETKEIRYTALARLPNVLRGKSLIGITAEARRGLKAPWPRLIIAAGRGAAPVMRYIKAKNPDTKLVQLMWPDSGADEFDCIVLPAHDREHPEKKNILRVLGAPHRLTAERLEEARGKWLTELMPYSGPRIAVLAGGSTKHGIFTKADWQKLAALAGNFAENTNGSLLVTASRRTGADGEHILKATSRAFYSPSQKDAENPYMGYLACADAIVATADSISMCSEACSTGKPVYLFEPASLSSKHKRFMNTLIAGGYAFPFTEEFTDEIRAPLKKSNLDSAQTVAEYIKKELL